MTLYRKKSLPEEAHQLPIPPANGTTSDAHELAVWDFIAWCNTVGLETFTNRDNGGILLETKFGPAVVDAGQWIVRNLRGEFYPLRPEVFSETYELVDTAALAALQAKQPASGDGGDEDVDEAWLHTLEINGQIHYDESKGNFYIEDDVGYILERDAHGDWYFYGTKIDDSRQPRTRNRLLALIAALGKVTP